jgi:hypothetical protein
MIQSGFPKVDEIDQACDEFSGWVKCTSDVGPHDCMKTCAKNVRWFLKNNPKTNLFQFVPWRNLSSKIRGQCMVCTLDINRTHMRQNMASAMHLEWLGWEPKEESNVSLRNIYFLKFHDWVLQRASTNLTYKILWAPSPFISNLTYLPHVAPSHKLVLKLYPLQLHGMKNMLKTLS